MAADDPHTLVDYEPVPEAKTPFYRRLRWWGSPKPESALDGKLGTNPTDALHYPERFTKSQVIGQLAIVLAEMERLRYDEHRFTARIEEEFNPGNGDEEWDVDSLVESVNLRIQEERAPLEREIADLRSCLSALRILHTEASESMGPEMLGLMDDHLRRSGH